jgi:hypothetical protein
MDLATIVFQVSLVGLALYLAGQVALDAIRDAGPSVRVRTIGAKSRRNIPASASAAKARERIPSWTAPLSR